MRTYDGPDEAVVDNPRTRTMECPIDGMVEAFQYEGSEAWHCEECDKVLTEDDPAVPFEKVTLAMPEDRVPGVGRLANGGGTLTLALIGWQKTKADELVAEGYRIIRHWRVEAGRVVTELPLELKCDCTAASRCAEGNALWEAANAAYHGGGYAAYEKALELYHEHTAQTSDEPYLCEFPGNLS